MTATTSSLGKPVNMPRSAGWRPVARRVLCLTLLMAASRAVVAQTAAPDVSLTSGELAFRNHDGGHTDVPDWPVFLEMAQRYFDAPADGARR